MGAEGVEREADWRSRVRGVVHALDELFELALKLVLVGRVARITPWLLGASRDLTRVDPRTVEHARQDAEPIYLRS